MGFNAVRHQSVFKPWYFQSSILFQRSAQSRYVSEAEESSPYRSPKNKHIHMYDRER